MALELSALAVRVASQSLADNAHKIGRVVNESWLMKRTAMLAIAFDAASQQATPAQAEIAATLMISGSKFVVAAGSTVDPGRFAAECFEKAEQFAAQLNAIAVEDVEVVATQQSVEKTLARMNEVEEAKRLAAEKEEEEKARAVKILNDAKLAAAEKARAVEAKIEEEKTPEDPEPPADAKLRATSVDSLDIEKRTKTAFGKASIETVGQVLDFYSTTGDLSKVHGVSDESAEETLAAIEALRKTL